MKKRSPVTGRERVQNVSCIAAKSAASPLAPRRDSAFLDPNSKLPSFPCVTGCGRSADDEAMEMLGGHGHCDAVTLELPSAEKVSC